LALSVADREFNINTALDLKEAESFLKMWVKIIPFYMTVKNNPLW
jgi:hypothetical protein